MPAKKIIVALLIIAVAIGGFVAGLVLLQENQDIEEEASTTTGTATVSLTPESGDYEVGDTIETSVKFNPNGVVINGVAVQLKYPFTGTTPEVTVSKIEVNSSLLSTGDWTCPTQNSDLVGNEVIIDIGCANTSSEGFTTSTDTLLAKITLNVTRTPESSPFVVSFNNVESVIYRKSDGQDILLVPASTGSYVIGGAEITAEPTEPASGTVTPTPTITATLTPTSTPSGTLTLTPTPVITKGGTLPDAGVSLPTIFGVSFGILVIAGAVMLAL